MLENIAFIPTKREKIPRLSTLKVGEGENLFRVPTLLSGFVEGCFRDLTEDSANGNPIVVHFSSRCKIFSSCDGLCLECKNLLKAHTI